MECWKVEVENISNAVSVESWVEASGRPSFCPVAQAIKSVENCTNINKWWRHWWYGDRLYRLLVMQMFLNVACWKCWNHHFCQTVVVEALQWFLYCTWTLNISALLEQLKVSAESSSLIRLQIERWVMEWREGGANQRKSGAPLDCEQWEQLNKF